MQCALLTTAVCQWAMECGGICRSPVHVGSAPVPVVGGPVQAGHCAAGGSGVLLLC